MGKLLKTAASPEIVNAAWKKCRREKTIWETGITRQEMEYNIGFHLLRLSKELAEGTYLPNPVRYRTVRKGNGKQRIISANTLRDKVAQRSVLLVLNPIGERIFHHDSFAYRPGRSVDMAIARVREYVGCGMEWLVDADIRSFFDEIPHKPLIRKLNRILMDRELTALIRRWLDAGAVRRGILGTTRGIPQGGVLSPFMCNLYLNEWDHDMASRNLPFVRFADDFLVFAQSRRDAEKALDYVRKGLERLDLQLHPEKTRVVKCSPNVRFLGRRLPKSPSAKKGGNHS